MPEQFTYDVETFEMRVITTLIALLLLWLTRAITLWLTEHLMHDGERRYIVRRRAGMIAGVIGVLTIARVWFSHPSELLTFLALVSAGLAIALRDILVDAAAWLYIVWRKPFKVGQRIELGEVRGDVVDLRLFQFTVLEIGNWVEADQSTGRVVHIPNGRIFSMPQANYSESFDFIWNETPVIVTYDSNWEHAKQLLQQIIEQHTQAFCAEAREQIEHCSSGYFIHYAKLTPTVYTRVDAGYGIVLTLRYLVPTRRRRSTEHLIWESILHEFAHHPDISFAYPTYRWYSQAQEAPTRPTPTYANGHHNGDHAGGAPLPPPHTTRRGSDHAG